MPRARFADDGREMVQPKDAADWRRWLEHNGATSDGIWLVYRKKVGGKRDLTYDQAVEEALCFGWIDSTIKPLDERHYRQFFSRRRPTSTWSKSNKDRVERLIANGRMTPAGQELIDAARANGMWTALDSIDNLEVPDDLASAFKRNRKAHDAFDGFSISSKKAILWWIASAKRSETRARRVAETARLAALGLRANHPEAKGR